MLFQYDYYLNATSWYSVPFHMGKTTVGTHCKIHICKCIKR